MFMQGKFKLVINQEKWDMRAPFIVSLDRGYEARRLGRGYEAWRLGRGYEAQRLSRGCETQKSQLGL